MNILREKHEGTPNIEKKDMIVGCIANYSVDNIKNWVNSINESGFTGEKRALSYNLSDDVIEYLENHGFLCHRYELKDCHIFVQRFFDQWHMLNQLDISMYRFIIATDTRDVIFQTNPSDWLEQNLVDKKILVSSECLRFVDEDWGNKTLKSCYGHLYKDFSQNVIFNAGTIAGEIKTMKDFFLNVYQFGLSAHAEESDQPALNILISLEHIKPLVKFAKQEDGWCTQLGAVMNPKTIDRYKTKLLEPTPKINTNGVVLNGKDVPFALVHQYDKIPELSDIIDKRYGGMSRNPVTEVMHSVSRDISVDRSTIYKVTRYIYYPLYKYAKKKNWEFVFRIMEKIKKYLLG